MATVQVPSVWPVGSNVSITGQVVCGDGHVVGGVLGAQLGTPTFTVTAPGTQVGGVSSAQSFGVPVIRAAIARGLTGITSAQAFGAVTIHATIAQPSGGVGSAQQFGAIVIVLEQKRPVAGIPSAQAFGAPRVVYTPQTVLVQGIDRLPTAYDSITGLVICGDGHLVGGENIWFGRVWIIYWQPILPLGLPSAQRFGAIGLYTHVWVQLGGVSSAQAFGHVTPHRYDLHLDCKPDGLLLVGCKPDGTFAITATVETPFTLTPVSGSGLTLTPSDDGDLVLVGTDQDG